MDVSLEMIVTCLHGNNVRVEVLGEDKVVNMLAALGGGVSGALCYSVGEKVEHLTGIKDSIVVCPPAVADAVDPCSRNTYLLTEDPQLAFYYASHLFAPRASPVVHDNAVIDPRAELGAGISIGPWSTIGACAIGDGAAVGPGVCIGDGTVIGARVSIEANTVIGATGVMWAWGPDGTKVVCSQTGRVVVEDDVRLGSNITIVRGAFGNRPTVIGRGTMIAHGTMIGHGSIIGQGNHFANNIAIAGSVQSGKHCFFGSGAVVRPHVKLSDDTIIGAGAVVVKDCEEPGQTLVGNPARRLEKKSNRPSGVPAPRSS